MRKFIVLLIIVLFGCDQLKPVKTIPKEQVEAIKAIEGLKNWANGGSKEDKSKKQKMEMSYAKDNSPVKRYACDSVRESGLATFGTEEGKDAKIWPTGIKEFGPDKWVVSGQYKGLDEKGRLFSSSWKATVNLYLDGLSCMSRELGERNYSRNEAKDE